MSKPSSETLPRGAKFAPHLLGEQDALMDVTVKHLVEFVCSLTVYDECILLIVES